MMNGTSLLCMGWKPEEGFLHAYWDWYNEGILAYALAIGSPTHPIPLANRHFCMDHAQEFPGYGENGWGLTAGQGPGGYQAYGTQPAEAVRHDGTLVPSGMVAAIPLVPYVAIPSVAYWHQAYGERVYGRYGFVSGFNLGKHWWSDRYIGIEQGVSVLMIENYRSGLVWKTFMREPAIQRWIDLCLTRTPGS